MSTPKTVHYGHLLHVHRYLRGTIDRRLFFSSSSSLQLYAYSNATWGSDSSDFKSLSAYCVFLGSSLTVWKTKKQTVVSCSSVEAKLRALVCVTAEVTWLRWLLPNFGVVLSSSMLMHCDSTGAINIAQDPVKHELTQHVGADCFYVRPAVQDKIIADLLTKAHT
jgi:hypothetical protein